MVDLVRFTPGVEWVGCSCLRNSADPKMVDEMARHVPVHGFAEDAVRPLLATTDVLVCWGPNSLDRAIPSDYPGKVVVVSHAAEVPWTAAVIRGGMASATHWVAVSEAAKRPYQGLVDLDRVTVIPNGIDPQRSLPRQGREATRRSIGLGSGEIVIGSIGRVSPAKWPLLLAEAVSRLGPPYRALYAGSWLTDESLREQIEKMLPARVTLLPAALDVGDLWAAIDVFALASRAEGFGLAVCEALYAGVRVVSGRVGVLIDIAAEHGVLWEEIPENATADDLARAIRTTLEMPTEAWAQRKAAARRAIDQKYLAAQMGQRWGDYLRRIVRGQGRKVEGGRRRGEGWFLGSTLSS